MSLEGEVVNNALPVQSARRIKSTFLLALLLFGALNFYLDFNTPISFDQYRYAYKSWAWWAMNDLRTSPEVHNVVLLGSSLVVSAIGACDANYHKKGLDLTQYHKAAYLDHRLRTTFGGSFSTFNLALPGQMPSDAYLALRAMVNCAHRPDVVIYGIAPRDFLDSTLNSPVDTEPFQYFRRLVNLDDVANRMFRTPLAKLDWFLHRNFYLYGKAMDFQLACVDLTTEFLSKAVPVPAGGKPFTWWDRTKLLPSYLPGEIVPNAVMSTPTTLKEALAAYSDNSKEYQARYKSPDPLTYKTQIYFLREMAKFCRKERIELIVVNMPVTIENAMILHPQVFYNYKQAMRAICDQDKITYFDLCDFEAFRAPDFHDTVHMNAFGGTKFLDLLVRAMTVDMRASSALALAGKELERHFFAESRPEKRTR